jgi:hypothetical protein
MLVLAVDLHQEIAQPLEEAHRRGGIVDEDAVPARTREFALDDELAIRGRVAGLFKGREEGPSRRHVEDGFDGGGIGARTDEIGLSPTAPHEEQGIDDDRLAGAVSPVRTFRPGANVTRVSSRTARFRMASSRSMVAPMLTPVDTRVQNVSHP